MYSCGPLHIDEQKQNDQLERTYSSSVPIRDEAQRTYWKQWAIGRGSERGPGISVQIARHDDDDDLKRIRKLLETEHIQGINTWVVHLVRFLGPFFKWTREKLRKMDQRKRKLMTMHHALHPREHVDRLQVSRKEGGRALTSIGDSVDTSIRRPETRQTT